MRSFFFLISAALVSMIIGQAFSGCSPQLPIEQVYICTEVSKDGEPVSVASTFTPDVNNIYCSVKLSAISNKSSVKAEWYITRSEDGQFNDLMIGNETIAANTPYVVFGFVRSDKLLPRGDYQVKLYYNNKYIRSANFKVTGEASKPTAILTEATTCTTVDLLSGKPLDKVNIFPNDTSTIYCSFRVIGADFATNIKARWIYVQGELEGIANKTIYTASTKAEGREYIVFSIGRAEGKSFPAGDYEITLMIEDEEQTTLNFKVVDPAMIPGPFVSEAATFTYTDENKKNIEITGKFPAKVPEIGLRARIYNAPPDTELRVTWILVRSDDAIYVDYLLKEDKATIEGTTPLIAYLKRGDKDMPKGDYSVRISFNGKEAISLPFKIQ